MRRAFENFMLSSSSAGRTTTEGSIGGKKKKKKSRALNSSSHEEVIGKLQNEQMTIQNKKLQILKNAQKKYWQIFNTFCNTVQREWMGIDDNLQDVLHSIANIRGRIPMESEILLSRLNNNETREWVGFGYNGPTTACGGFLTTQDVTLAMSHDLLQHEKMMSGVRTLLAAMSDAQEKLGRQLNDVMQHHLDTTMMLHEVGVDLNTDSFSSSIMSAMCLVDDMNEMHSVLAMELYRKQNLALKVLQTSNDDIFGGDVKALEVDDVEDWSRKTADICCKEWPRGSKTSCVDMKKLMSILRKRDS